MATIYLTNGSDNRVGTADGDYIYGYKEGSSPQDDVGADTIDGAGGSDNIEGGGGDDKLFGGIGYDYIYGQGGSDTIDVGIDGGSARGGDGNDTLIGSDVSDYLYGDAGEDTLTGGKGNDNLIDGAYNDKSTKDTLNAGEGEDSIESYGGIDTIDGGAGIDALYLDRSFALVGLTFNMISPNQVTTLVGDGTTVTGVELFRIYTGLGADTITLGAAGDTIDTDAGVDTIKAGDGRDTVSAGADDDFLYGEAGDDYLYGEGGNDLIDGGSGDDQIVDGNSYDVTSDDTIYGGIGYDSIRSVGGKDTIDGGADFDWLTFDRGEATADLILILTSTAVKATVQGDGSTIVNVEDFDIRTGSGNDQITTLDADDTIYGGAGDDTLIGGAGHDSINGGSGKDWIELGTDSGYAYGEEDDDTIFGSEANDTVHGGGGSDKLYAGAGSDNVTDGYSSSAAGDDVIEAGDGDDTIYSYGGVDTIDGGADFDSLTLERTSASKALTFEFQGSAGVTTLLGDGTTVTGVERFYIRTGSGKDVVTTGNADDTIYGGGDDDTLDGAGGSDTLVGNQGNDVLRGGAGRDYLYGDDGSADGGNDTMDLGADGGQAYGYNGNDIYIQSSKGNDDISEASGDGIDEVQTTYTYALLEIKAGLGAFENLTLIGNDAIDGTGNELDNVIKGNSAQNTLIGLVGKDTLHGLGNNDTLDGGVDDDTYVVDANGYVIIEAVDDGTADTVKASASYDLRDAVHVEFMRTVDDAGTAAINLYGNAFKQEITGNAGANLLSDGGKGAADTMRGLGGNDTYRVYNSGDVIVETSSQGAKDTVLAAVSYRLTTGAHVEVLSTISAGATSAIKLYGNELGQTINGNAGANVLRGYAGDDTINGGAGADRIAGGLGNDTLAGNAGADIYYFSYALNGTTNVDTIKGFSSIDLINLSSSIFSKAGPAGALAAGAFWASADGKAHDSSDRILYETDTGILRYDPDGTGTATAIKFAIMAGLPSMNAGDFVIA
ncbi:MAG: hypothetical protein KF914_12940 [Rhizobiaceae bacterium]|nr:hypothetical protein [Rhizobiaceae bacterium]